MIPELLNKARTDLDIPNLVNELEVEMLKHDQVNCPVHHHFGPGVYVREVNLPAGIFAIGHGQTKEHLNIFIRGRVSMVNDDGSITELVAPMIFTGQPGRKFGYIHEDVVWLNIYPTTETDIETLEGTYLDKSDNWKSVQKTEDRKEDQDDYKLVLKEYGYTEKQVREVTENEDDQIPFPHGSYSVGVFDSGIQGKGLFAMAGVKKGNPIVETRIDGMRTPAGRYTNHAKRPNAVMREVGNIVYLVATEDIDGCKGGIIGEEITVDYRKVLELQGKEKLCQESPQQ